VSRCLDVIEANWPAPAGVRAFTTTRRGGVSTGCWSSLNLGSRCGDQADRVSANRQVLQGWLPAPPSWMRQVHGVAVQHLVGPAGPQTTNPCEAEADAQWTTEPRRICAVLTADCLPVVFCAAEGDVVGVAHAGWRGLAAGVLEATLRAMPRRDYLAWLGPAIGPDAYEVGHEVLEHFKDDREVGFRPSGDRWLMDLYSLARERLWRAGLRSVFGGDHCTWSEPDRFYSYRRDGTTGRMATVIWRDSDE
jgi:YfiH family protein